MYTMMSAKWTVRYPTGHASKLASVTVSSSDLGARNGLTFSTASELTVLQEIMTETGFWSSTSNEACGRVS